MSRRSHPTVSACSGTARVVEDWDLHFTSWHQHVWKPVITAVNGICAGGAFHWVADADIVICSSDAQFFDPHVSVGQVVSIEAIGLMRKMPVEAVMRMAFVGRHERMSAAAGVRAGHGQRGRRPARAAPRTRRRSWPRRSREQSGGDGGDQASAVGRARDRPDRRVPRGRAASWCRCGVIPIRRRDRLPSPRSVSRTGSPSTRKRADAQRAIMTVEK